jgi:hypothetical protein
MSLLARRVLFGRWIELLSDGCGAQIIGKGDCNSESRELPPHTAATVPLSLVCLGLVLI